MEMVQGKKTLKGLNTPTYCGANRPGKTLDVAASVIADMWVDPDKISANR